MRFDELDSKLRVYETAYDFSVPPNIYLVARIDGRSFTRLTKEKHPFDRPFDERFRDMMVETTKHLMQCGFKIVYGYTESDEISLLFDFHEDAFSRKPRKYNSILAGEASAKFSLLLGDIGAFDCRISQLPRPEDVINYFRWRHEDAHRNSLNAHCYWMLREQGKSSAEATKAISGKSVAFKNQLLFENGVNFNNIPAWQKRGVGLYWTNSEKTGWNPVKQEETVTTRKTIAVDLDLPMGAQYNRFVASLVNK
ncbi:guanylyltransferase [Fulvitalea axinellae]|uniref:tRNA(His) guanylyltransferase n=1 Tax=Fulvitalea axinellae TaxID=1182444 RepID=A0AAU9CT36_9BACT|nr:guanylyltransferase [Fulvitalea axinellae]